VIDLWAHMHSIWSLNGCDKPRELLMLGLVSSRFRIQRLFLKNFFSQVHQTEAILSNSRRLFHAVEGVLYVSSVLCLLGCIKRPKGRSFIPSLILPACIWKREGCWYPAKSLTKIMIYMLKHFEFWPSWRLCKEHVELFRMLAQQQQRKMGALNHRGNRKTSTYISRGKVLKHLQFI
jgi:hypothetical protein